MEDIEKIKKEVKSILSEKRYIHSIGVMERAKELAKIYNEDEKKAELIGIVHDIAKEMTKEEMIEYAKKNNIEIDEIEKENPSLLHGKIGADICQKKYGFSKDMLNAIKYHTTGNKNMTTLDKIIYLADKTENNRTYDDLEYAKKLSDNNLNEAMMYCLNIVISSNVEKNRLIHLDTIIARNEILMEINKEK